MVSGMWGKKIGMTQIFADDRVIPVTAINVAGWLVTNIKTRERDGYYAVQVGCVKKRHTGKGFSKSWLKQPKEYFTVLREIRLHEKPENISVGQAADFYTLLAEGDQVDAFGKSRGRGFAGVVKRHNFSGAPASHGATMGKTTGSIGFMTSQGKVIKGKKMPGHMGAAQCMMKNLDVVKIEKEAQIILVKGSIPGHKGSLVFIRKANV